MDNGGAVLNRSATAAIEVGDIVFAVNDGNIGSIA